MTPHQEQALRLMREALVLLDADGGITRAANRLQFAIDTLTDAPQLQHGAEISPELLALIDQCDKAAQ